MQYTQNYKLRLPEGPISFDPDYDNSNYQIIDVELKKNADAAENAQTAADTANAAIGDIATLLDAINGEVI